MFKLPARRRSAPDPPRAAVRECPAFAAQAPRHSPLRPGRRCAAPSSVHSPSAPPRRLPRGLPRTYCSLCRRDAGKRCNYRWPRPPAAAGPPAPFSERPPGRLRPRQWPAPYDDTELRGARRPPPEPRACRRPPSPRPSPPGPAARLAMPEHFLSPFKGRGSRLAHIRLPGAFWDLEFVGGADSPRLFWQISAPPSLSLSGLLYAPRSAATWPCSHAAVQPRKRAAMQLCSHAAVQPGRHSACSHATV